MRPPPHFPFCAMEWLQGGGMRGGMRGDLLVINNNYNNYIIISKRI